MSFDKTARRAGTLVKIARQSGIRGVAGAVASLRDYHLEPEVMQSAPLFLQVEPTIRCNLECSFCINPFLPRSRTSLTLPNFERILDQVPSTTKISLVGIGESFMNKELWALIRLAKARGLEIGTTSNGTILTDRLLQEIVDARLDWLNFSIDGATKATYEAMRPGAEFEKVLANIRRIVEALDGQSRPKVGVWFLSTQTNIHELPYMVDVVQSLGIRELNTQGVHYWGHPDWHDRATEANRVENLLTILDLTKARADAAGIQFQWHNMPDADQPRACKWPWKGAYITADGFVTPCCENGSDPARINFGNVLERPFSDIWNSPEYQRFRRDLKATGSRPEICQDCPSYNKTVALGSSVTQSSP